MPSERSGTPEFRESSVIVWPANGRVLVILDSVVHDEILP